MGKVFIENQKGQKIATDIRRPKTQTEKLAILCPGFLDTKDYQHLIALADVLATKGYTVARFDPIGTWESEGDVSQYTNTQYLEDIKSVLEFMLSRAKYSHILLGGHSRGGQLSLLYTARDSRISVVVGIMPSSGPSQRKDWDENGIRISFREIPGSKEVREYRVPVSHAIDRDKYDVVKDATNIHVPAIFLAGELDDTVPPEDVKEIFDNTNEPKKYILLKGIGHDYRHNQKEIEVVNNKILEALGIA